MKKLFFVLIIFVLIYSCSKTEKTIPSAPLTSCDSLKLGLIKLNTFDTLRLLTCLKITSCDSFRLGILKPSTQDTLRLLSCIKISSCDSIRLGVLKPNTQDTLRLLSCIKITGCDSIRLGVLKPNIQDSLRLLSCLKISTLDSIRLGLILNIGQIYQGGKIAYILVPGDLGYDANKKHGLIAATTDQSTGIRWYNGIYMTTIASDTAIGNGSANTNRIISYQGDISTSYAAGLVKSYNGGGYNDWYLPNKAELNQLYINKTMIGGFTNGYYWSSSEYNFNFAWALDFSNGYPFYNGIKNQLYYVRAIRSF